VASVGIWSPDPVLHIVLLDSLWIISLLKFNFHCTTCLKIWLSIFWILSITLQWTWRFIFWPTAITLPGHLLLHACDFGASMLDTCSDAQLGVGRVLEWWLIVLLVASTSSYEIAWSCHYWNPKHKSFNVVGVCMRNLSMSQFCPSLCSAHNRAAFAFQIEQWNVSKCGACEHGPWHEEELASEVLLFTDSCSLCQERIRL